MMPIRPIAPKIVTLIASLWIVFELINVWWPRTPDAPWYQNYAVLFYTGVLAVLGVIAYALAPRHAGKVGGAPPAEVTEAAAFAGE